MKKILFICLGNICRSPMAEFIMKDLVKKANLEKEFFISSAGTSGVGGKIKFPFGKIKLP